MSKPFLIIQLRPEDETADSEYAAMLHYGGLDPAECVRVRAEQAGLPDINLADFSAIIVGGSPFDISTPADEKSAIQVQVEADFNALFDRVIPDDFPFLGCCSGNGLLGNYCGASISRTYGEPVSAQTISLTDAGKADALLAGCPDDFRVLLGHKEACDETPPGATLLAGSEACPVQMFRVGENVYATQFHPEGDPAGFATRIEVYRHHGYFDPDGADALIKTLSSEDTPDANRILRRFVDRYRAG